ncbi:MAG: Trp family transcriptional regulator [Verrucomicrobiota bacterium]
MSEFRKQKRQLVKKIHSLNSESAVESFLDTILTDREMEEIVHRLQIIKLLKKGVSQREIVAKLGVGIATVTRGSKALKSGKFDKLIF